MNRTQLVNQIKTKKSFLCVGLDTDKEKLPPHLLEHPDAIFQFNKEIVDATLDHCVGYKINTAFYEAMGLKGWEAMEKTVHYIPNSHFKIADAKRGDIGNTSSRYAKAFFENLPFDAITVSPYMGEDSIRPFLEYENKWTIVLALTSNAGAHDFELQKISQSKDAEKFLYESVLEKVAHWGTANNLMFVMGATQPKAFAHIRSLLPDHFFLVPGIGAQGGDLEGVSSFGMNADCGLLVNASRAILYASQNDQFAVEAKKVAQSYQLEMGKYLERFAESLRQQ